MSLLPFTAAAAVLLLMASGTLLAQQIRQDTREAQMIQERMLFDGLVESNDAEKADAAKRTAARETARELLAKVNAFADEFNKLGVEFAKGIWNVKQAAKVTKAWHKLHDDPAWIEKDKEKQ